MAQLMVGTARNLGALLGAVKRKPGSIARNNGPQIISPPFITNGGPTTFRSTLMELEVCRETCAVNLNPELPTGSGPCLLSLPIELIDTCVVLHATASRA